MYVEGLSVSCFSLLKKNKKQKNCRSRRGFCSFCPAMEVEGLSSSLFCSVYMYVCEEKKKDNLVGVLLWLQVLICSRTTVLRLGALALMMNLTETLIRDESACPVDFAQLLFVSWFMMSLIGLVAINEGLTWIGLMVEGVVTIVIE